MEEEEDGAERLRQRKLEEALEAKSLRRIISAFLNYPEAAEEDVKRYERSFRKLPPAHKALLSHYPQKFQRLRQCISANSYFIFSMLQAFEPPIDLSQEIDICEHSDHENMQNGGRFSSERKICSNQTALNSGSLWSSTCEAASEDGDDAKCKAEEKTHNEQELASRGHHDSRARSPCGCSEFQEQRRESDGNSLAISNRDVSSSSCDWLDPSLQLHVPLVDIDKVRCIIRNIVRDWAAEGQKERDQCFKPILEELDALFPNRSGESPPSCLVPGAGLGRLALEISSLALKLLMSGQYIPGSIAIAIHFQMVTNFGQCQFQMSIQRGITEGFSMCGGDFVEVYSDPCQVGIWDSVVTCFFIDTAHNIVEYIEIISKILKEGGVWINLGPLLYHFADMCGEDEMSIELSLEDVKRVALHYGFVFENEKTIETTYTTNPRAMMQNRYYAAFWTMRKKSAAANAVSS
ncbi:carnosine N-methyltransferase-like isoform X3 [Rhodamnia argentea]|uniref:carnosine N-methyltransferase n=1 Tax=Rhodamnia argentea TaxID=178133 RepID=A0ABM3HR78_9MYRT|nr:carnosine N-methyltransferase-like isoform X3 [Rhodamnia argentea]